MLNIDQVKIETIRVEKDGLINYCYIISSVRTKYAYLIDPAWDFQKIDNLLKFHKLILMGVLVTHSHFDHINLVEAFSEKYNVLVYASERESIHYDFFPKKLVTLQGNESIYNGFMPIKVVLTPGHTYGSTCFFIDNNLFTGDTLFIEGCGVCDVEGSDPNEMYLSLAKIKKLCTNETKIFPGHSFGIYPGASFGTVLKNNIYLQIENLDFFIKFRMRQNQTKSFEYK